MSKHYRTFKAEEKLSQIFEEAVSFMIKLGVALVVLFLLAIFIKENGLIAASLMVGVNIFIFIVIFMIGLKIICGIFRFINALYAKQYIKEAIINYWPKDLEIKEIRCSKYYRDEGYYLIYVIEIADIEKWYLERETNFKEELFSKIRLDICKLENLWISQKDKLRVYVGIDYVDSEKTTILFDKEQYNG